MIIVFSVYCRHQREEAKEWPCCWGLVCILTSHWKFSCLLIMPVCLLLIFLCINMHIDLHSHFVLFACMCACILVFISIYNYICKMGACFFFYFSMYITVSCDSKTRVSSWCIMSLNCYILLPKSLSLSLLRSLDFWIWLPQQWDYVVLGPR